MSINFSDKKIRLSLIISAVLLVIGIIIFSLWAYLYAPIASKAIQIAPPITTPSSSPSKTPLSATINIPIPKNIATGQNFYLAINSVVTDMENLETINNNLTQALKDISIRNTQNNYSGILTRINTARSLSFRGVEMLSKLKIDTNKLVASQAYITNAQVAQKTSSFIVATKKYTLASYTYFSSLSPVLNGSFPNQKQIDAVTIAVQNINAVNIYTPAQALFSLLHIKALEAKQIQTTP